jgi:hypothetical protein
MIVNMPELRELRERTLKALTESTEAFEHALNYSQMLKVTKYQKYLSDTYDSMFEILGKIYRDEENNYKRVQAYTLDQLTKLSEIEVESTEVNRALACQLDMIEILEDKMVAANSRYVRIIPEEYVHFFDKYKELINDMLHMYEKLKYQEMHRSGVRFFSDVVWHSITELSRVFWVLRQEIKGIYKGRTGKTVQQLGVQKHLAETQQSWLNVKSHAEEALLPPKPIPVRVDRAAITKNLTERVEIVKQRLDEMLDTEIIETVQKVSYMLGRYGGLYAALLLAHDETSDEKFKKTTDKIDERLEKLESDSIELAVALGYMA